MSSQDLPAANKLPSPNADAPPDTQAPTSDTKKALRKILRARRLALTRGEQYLAALGLGRQFKRFAANRRITRVGVYFANDGEIDPSAIVQWCWKTNKQPLLPVLHPTRTGELLFLPWLPETPLARNRFGIPEPDSARSNPRPVWTLDVILTPLVGFDVQCSRLGMGGGYYDRTLAPAFTGYTPRRPLLIGVAHECQKVENLPIEAWDIPLDGVLTGDAFYQRIRPV
ncbi:5-formyltetrahydrofolate cyclo-ligase family protein [gamma proteobacterium HdN1]|nr:5-formyltetrahydrofolate cyclo-ligase family protein [gamma proteobacterium HdN1]